MVDVIDNVIYPFLALQISTSHLEDKEIGVYRLLFAA